MVVASGDSTHAAMDHTGVHMQEVVLRSDRLLPSGCANLREMEGMLLAAQRLAKLGNWSLELQTGRLRWSEEAHRIFGMSHAQLQELGVDRFLQHVHAEDRPALRRLIASGSGRQLATEFGYRFICADGSVKVIRGWGESQLDAQGRPWRMVGTVMDVSEQQQLLHQARVQADRARAMTDCDDVWLWEQDDQFRFTFLSNKETVFRQVLGRTRWEAGFEPLCGSWGAHRECLLAHKPFRNFEVAVPGQGGDRILSATGAPTFDENGRFTGYRGTTQDVTARHRADQRARQVQSLLEVAAALGRVGGWVLEVPSMRLSGSSELAAILEIEEGCAPSAQDIIGLVDAADRDSLRDGLSALVRDGAPLDVEVKARTARGRAIWLRFAARAERGPDGAVREIRGAIKDITQRREDQQELLALNASLEDRVRQRTRELQQANDELRGFSGALAHDLRNTITGITAFAGLLETALQSAEGRLQHYAHRVLEGTLRLDEQMKALLALSRVSQAQLVMTEVDLSGLAASVVQDLREREPARDVQLEIQQGLKARGDARLLRLLLENLIGNAWKFTSKRACARIRFDASAGPTGEIEYRVSDNGAGFDSAYVSRLFGNFQRLHSHDDFPGHGLGLANVRRVVERHGGRVWADSVPGQGATFGFTLDARAAEASHLQDAHCPDPG
jgi:signal transduction histidine kinase